MEELRPHGQVQTATPHGQLPRRGERAPQLFDIRAHGRTPVMDGAAVERVRGGQQSPQPQLRRLWQCQAAGLLVRGRNKL